MMNLKAPAILIILLAAQTNPALASDWIEDEQVQGFYSRGVQQNTNSPPADSQYSIPQRRAPAADFQPDEFDSDAVMNGLDPYPNVRKRMNSPGQPSQGQQFQQFRGQQFQPPPEKKGVLSKAKAIGKSIVRGPADFFAGTGDMLDSPGFWQGAGALAGTGANAYMNYRFMKNNPYYYNRMYSPYGAYGALNPYGVYNPYNPLNPYGGAYFSTGGTVPNAVATPNGLINPNNPFNYWSSNPLGYNPYRGNYWNGLGAVNPLGGFGSPYGGFGLGSPLGGFGMGSPFGFGSYGLGNGRF